MKRILLLVISIFIVLPLAAQNKTTVHETGTGKTTTIEHADGSKTIVVSTPCLVCGQSGRCGYCGGAGFIPGMFGPMFCYLCSGTGRCGVCGGVGEVTYTSYLPATPAYSAPAGGYGGGGTSNYGNGSSGSSTTSSRRTCPGCNGTGKGPDRIEYAPNYTGGDNSRYCSQCGRTMSAHTHIQGTCTVCYGRGYVD